MSGVFCKAAPSSEPKTTPKAPFLIPSNYWLGRYPASSVVRGEIEPYGPVKMTVVVGKAVWGGDRHIGFGESSGLCMFCYMYVCH